MAMEKDLKNMALGELEALAEELGEKRYAGTYAFHFIHGLGVSEISQITPVSKTFRTRLADKGYYISKLKTVDKLVDPDGTVKYLFELPDGNRIESVLLSDGRRRTACISTQVGCAMKCAFCATGRLGLKRDLSVAEIVEQFYSIQRDVSKVSNVVYMGMGEPLSNYDNVVKSIRLLNSGEGTNLGIRHITVSTCGHGPGILRLADEDIHPRLAISLNAGRDGLRSELMPINRKYPLGELFEAVGVYQEKTGDRVTIEYVMMAGVNDQPEHARALTARLKGVSCNVNLIEYNPHLGCKFAASGRAAIERFSEIVRKSGIETVVRLGKGGKVKAACGQLGSERTGKGEPGRNQFGFRGRHKRSAAGENSSNPSEKS